MSLIYVHLERGGGGGGGGGGLGLVYVYTCLYACIMQTQHAHTPRIPSPLKVECTPIISLHTPEGKSHNHVKKVGYKTSPYQKMMDDVEMLVRSDKMLKRRDWLNMNSGILTLENVSLKDLRLRK